MFHRQPTSDFYLTGTSFYSSDSESDSDIEMASTVKRNTGAAKVHKKLAKFFKDSELKPNVFAENLKCFEAMFKVKPALWAAFAAQKKAFVPTATMEDKLKCAISIGDAAVQIRKEANMGLSVITTNNVSVTLQGLSAAEVTCLNELLTLLHKKMVVGGSVAPKTGDATQMVRDFLADMEIAKTTGIILPKYLKAHKIWAIYQHASQKGIDMSAIEKTGDNDWDDLVTVIENRKMEAKPNTEGATLNMANKFAVDTFAVTINHVRETVVEGERTLDNILKLLERVAAFTKSSSISSLAWDNFIKSKKNTAFTAFFANLTDGNTLYDNPGKLTKNRLIACAGCLFPSYDPTAIFCTNDRRTATPKLIAEIYTLEKENDDISPDPATTSTSEHLLHLLLCLGDNFSYANNRNHIPSSVRNTKFTILNL